MKPGSHMSTNVDYYRVEIHLKESNSIIELTDVGKVEELWRVIDGVTLYCWLKFLNTNNHVLVEVSVDCIEYIDYCPGINGEENVSNT